MDSIGYAALSRMSGLTRELDTVANNIANMSTTGYRREGIVFAEHVKDVGPGHASLSMGSAVGRTTNQSQGPLDRTNGSFDLAIEGSGFFLVSTPLGDRLTRAGDFSPNSVGELSTPEGYILLDEGGAPVLVPPDAKSVAVASDGTISADGNPLGRIGLFEPVDPLGLTRAAGTLFVAETGVENVEDGRILQGFVETSNVNAVSEVARLIEVQRAYELGQSFLDKEDERVRTALRTLTS